MDQRTAIRQFLIDLLRKKGDSEPFSDSDSLLLSGRLQSLEALELIIFLEENYGFDFADHPFDQVQIDSVDQVMALLVEA
jgi:acyl carrier protein